MSHPTDPNFSGKRVELVAVEDNDQANILLAFSPPGEINPKTPVTGPVKIWEEPDDFFTFPEIRKRKIWIKLQVPPLVDGDPCQPSEVKLNMKVVHDTEADIDNLPGTDPCLPYEEIDDPNGLIFTAANYDTYQSIQVWGNDDAELQWDTEEGEYPAAKDDELYQAFLDIWVVDDGGDGRYAGFTKEAPKRLQFDVEDNECGAFGRLQMDIGNSDPCAIDEDGNPLPDCYVDIYDAIEVATQWLDCTDPQDISCI
jgi:hypothetical protein